MAFETIAEDDLDYKVTGGIDWNLVGMQAMQGAATGATFGWATGLGAIGFGVGGAALGGGLAVYSTWNQKTVK